jgi:hypothetical protein
MMKFVPFDPRQPQLANDSLASFPFSEHTNLNNTSGSHKH